MTAALPSRCTVTLKGHTGPVHVVRYNESGTYCVTGSSDRSVKLWNPARGLCIKTYSAHGYDVLDVAVLHDNSKLASCGGDKSVFLWDVATGRVIRKFRGHENRVNAIRVHKEGTVLVSGSYDRSVRAFDLRAQSLDAMQVISDFKDSVTSLVLTDHEILVGSVDGCVRCFDIRAGTVFADHINKPVTSISLSNDGNCILASCLDSTLRLFDKTNGDLLNEYTGHTNTSYKVESCLTHNDAHVCSGSEDHKIRIWDLVEGNLVRTLEGHTGTVTGLVHHPNEPCILSASVDSTIQVWKP